MTGLTQRQAGLADAPACQLYFGLLDAAAACDALHGFEVTLDNRVVAPELHPLETSVGADNLPVTRAAFN